MVAGLASDELPAAQRSRDRKLPTTGETLQARAIPVDFVRVLHRVRELWSPCTSTVKAMRDAEAPLDAAGEALERHPSLDDRFDPAVRIVDYDPAWSALASEELRRVGEALGKLAVGVEHVGSTAVPGLAAKPILDLQLSVAAIEPRARSGIR